MELREEDVIEFQRLYKKHFGEDIPVEEARMRASNLVRLYMAVYFSKSNKSNGRTATSKSSLSC